MMAVESKRIVFISSRRENNQMKHVLSGLKNVKSYLGIL